MAFNNAHPALRTILEQRGVKPEHVQIVSNTEAIIWGKPAPWPSPSSPTPAPTSATRKPKTHKRTMSRKMAKP